MYPLKKCFIRMPVGRISTRRGEACAVNPPRIKAGKYPFGGLEIRPTDACSPAFLKDSFIPEEENYGVCPTIGL